VTPDRWLRVSAAALSRVEFDHPASGAPWLAFERRATLLPREPPAVRLTIVPFGGAVRLRNPGALASLVPGFRFDSARSESEQDFRILIPAEAWPAVRAFCRAHLAAPDDPYLDSSPDRELREEFHDALRLTPEPSQYVVQPLGLTFEDEPEPTQSVRAPGWPTVRAYRIWSVRLLDPAVTAAILASSRIPSSALMPAARDDAANGGRGRANAALALPLAAVRAALLALPPSIRHLPFTVQDHNLDGSVSALFPELRGTARIWHSA
jgi:hypothetical protein